MKTNTLISNVLIEWYSSHKRDLPWRATNDPYKIWISEIILQQTRVSQGLEYYLRFVDRFPDVYALAEADEREVLKYWEGLGYYSRARNLHAAARTVVEEMGGIFPSDYDSVIGLKGIGEYTAAAIVSFVWNRPYPVVDGNVFRVLSRLFAIEEPIDSGKGKRLFTQLAGELMDSSRAGLYNQAVMEFGALQCVPVSPDCENCPLVAQCIAFADSRQEDFPVKQNRIRTQDRHHIYFYIHSGEYTYIKKREGKGIWQNLFEFPSVESLNPLPFDELSENTEFRQLFPNPLKAEFRLKLENKKHVLSHRIVYATFYEVFLSEESPALASFLRIKPDDVRQYPVHRLMQLYLQNTNF